MIPQHSLEIWIPSSQEYNTVIDTLEHKFPYREGDWFDQTVTGMKAPSGYWLAFIRLDQPMSEVQQAYMEHGKQAGMISSYSTNEVAGY